MPKCRECGKREATKPDSLCDHCRYMLILNDMAKKKK